MFGGADSRSADRVPSDILVEGNYFTKRLEWKGAGVAVKNLFELKSARRITIRGNVFERNWTDAQTGFGILLKAVNQDGTAPWSLLEDVLFENNVVRDTENGFNILGNDYATSVRTATRITIRNNLILTPGVGFSLAEKSGTSTIDHNTIAQRLHADVAVSRHGVECGCCRCSTGCLRRRTADLHEQSGATTTNTASREKAPAVGTPSLTAHTVGFTLDEQRAGRRSRTAVSSDYVVSECRGLHDSVRTGSTTRGREPVLRSSNRWA